MIKKPDLNIITFAGIHGYSLAINQLILGLIDLGYKVKRIFYNGSNNIKRYDKETLADKTILSINPIFMKQYHKVGKTFVYTMFETEKIVPDIVKMINYFDGVIVPCKHNVHSFIKSGVNKPIKRVYLCVDPTFFTGDKIQHKKFVFISHGSHSMRKGTDLMIKAFLEEFKKEKDVRLILKDSSSVIQDYKLPVHDTRIKRVVGRIPLLKLKKLLLSSDCGLFPSRGEGWGLGAMECMATGLPVILTNYGGLADMCDVKYNYPLNVEKLVSSKPYYTRFSKIYKDVGMWAEPDLNHLKKLMRHVYENRKEGIEKGQLASRWIKDNFNRKNQAKKIAKIMKL